MILSFGFCLERMVQSFRIRFSLVVDVVGRYFGFILILIGVVIMILFAMFWVLLFF